MLLIDVNISQCVNGIDMTIVATLLHSVINSLTKVVETNGHLKTCMIVQVVVTIFPFLTRIWLLSSYKFITLFIFRCGLSNAMYQKISVWFLLCVFNRNYLTMERT